MNWKGFVGIAILLFAFVLVGFNLNTELNGQGSKPDPLVIRAAE